MKQLLFTLILFLSVINVLQAQETNPIEETTWNVIRERLFNGENSKAYRFQEDIRFQLTGEATKEDSAVIQKIISELNDLIEIVNVKLVNKDGNFIINFLPDDNGVKQKTNYRVHGVDIFYTEIWFSFDNQTPKEKVEKEITYYVYRYLTRIFETQFQATFYGGIFDQPFPQIMPLHEIDKDLLRKLYSKDFYKNLRKNTVNKYNTLYYLNWRYENIIKNVSISFLVIITILIFLYLLSTEKDSDRKITLWRYLKRNIYIYVVIAFVFSLLTFPSSFFVLSTSNFLINISKNTAATFIFVIFSNLVMFYIERFASKYITNFWQQQLLVFFNTFFSVIVAFSLVYTIFTSIYSSLSFGSFGYNILSNTPIPILIISIAFLRVFYDVIKYRMQSIVNQKDVELAKMKELKNQAELNALHSRINPHFLYNSLNSIAELAHINPVKTENMAVALSELFRYSINKENKTFVTVEEELEMVKKYLEIEKTRFAEKLNYTITVDEAAKEKLIPKFLIQPLAENAVKHGLSKITETGKIAIEVKQLENDLVIAIFDNGPDFPDEPVSGYGLQNLNDKLEIIYGKQATIYWENGNNKHFRITIKNQF